MLNGCGSVHRTFYESTGGIPQYSKSAKTELLILKGNESNFNARRYAVLFATENDTSKYILFAPWSSSTVKAMHNVYLNYSVKLMPGQINELHQIIKDAMNNWNNVYPVDKGVNYEFVSMPEVFKRDSINAWVPAFSFNYQNNNKGSFAVIFFGERDPLRFLYEFEKLKELEDFVFCLEEAKRKLEE